MTRIYRISNRWLPFSVLLAAVALLPACDALKGRPERLAIVYTNDVRGEIRSCGCASHDLGGLGRRATFMRVLRDTTTADVLLVDAGDFFSASINYGKEKAELAMKSMALMNYDGVVPGEKEFGFGIEYFQARARVAGLPVLASNLYDAAADTLLFPASRVVTLRSGLRVGLIGVLSEKIKMPPQVLAGAVAVRDPAASVQAAVDAVRPNVDVVVVLAHMSRAETKGLAEQLEGVDVVVQGHDGLPMRHVQRWGEPYVLQVSAKGMYVGMAYATLDRAKRVKTLTSSIVGLDKKFVDDEAVGKLFAAYDIDIAEREKAKLPASVATAFAGANTCQPCHAAIFSQWEGTRHAHAFEVLTAQKREFDRDCTPCHTTGFFKQGGFVNASATPNLAGVQCESCHGNGFAHAKDPKVKTDTVAKSTCRGCHTAEQTPEFEFTEFWSRIDHGVSSAAGSR
jgi:Cytochrome c554 and c-prime